MDDIKLTTGSMLEKLILDIEKTVINAKENISYSVNHTITETYWTMAELFLRDRSVIGKHVRNVIKEGELSKESV